MINSKKNAAKGDQNVEGTQLKRHAKASAKQAVRDSRHESETIKREEELKSAAKAAARKFSFGAPQETNNKSFKPDIKLSAPKPNAADQNTISIESKPVILIGKRQSAMRPGSIPEVPPLR